MTVRALMFGVIALAALTAATTLEGVGVHSTEAWALAGTAVGSFVGLHIPNGKP